jgi:pre-mRNA-processing factor 40
MDIRPLFQDDARYQGILGQAGSTPLDLFWDMLEEEERSLRGPRNDVLDVLDVSSRPSKYATITTTC